jgi:hypothetical protein
MHGLAKEQISVWCEPTPNASVPAGNAAQIGSPSTSLYLCRRLRMLQPQPRPPPHFVKKQKKDAVWASFPFHWLG